VNKFSRVIASTVLIGLSTLALTGCAAGGSSEPLRIGLEAPLSGEQAVTGEDMLRGAQLAADEINSAGGVGGRQIEIVPIDDAADPDTGVTAATAAIEAGLDGVVGPYNSGVGIKTLPLYIEAGIVPIHLTTNSQTNSLGYTLQPKDYQIAPVAADGLKAWLGAKSVAIVYDETTDYTVGIAETLKAKFEKDGITVPAYLPIQPGSADYASTVTEASASGADVVYAATYFPEGAIIAKDVFALKITQPCVLDYGAYDPGYITNAGSVEVAQACALVGVPSPTDFPQGAAFVAAYDKDFALKPGTWSPYTYDSVKLFAEAVAAAGGTDASKLIDYLNGVKDWQGATGSVTIDPTNGNREPATVVFLRVTTAGDFRVDQEWATSVGAPY